MSIQFANVLTPLSTAARLGLKWWGSELRDCADGLLARIAPKLAKRVEIQLDAPIGRIEQIMGRKRRQIARFDYGDTGLLATATSAIGELQDARATIVLGANDVLRHEVKLPDAVEGTLDQVVNLHLERELPLVRDRMCIHYHIARRLRSQRQIVIELLITHKERVDHLRELAQRWGLRPVRIAAVGAHGNIVGNFIPARFSLRRGRLQPLDRRLARSALTLTILWGCLTAGQWAYERIAVGRDLSRAAASAQAATVLSHRLETQSEPARELAQVAATPDAADVLATLTDMVPQDAWAYELEVKAASGTTPTATLLGFAPAATMLVDSLEKSHRFSRVRLVSFVSAGLGSAQDRLQLTAQLAAPKAASPPSAATAHMPPP